MIAETENINAGEGKHWSVNEWNYKTSETRLKTSKIQEEKEDRKRLDEARTIFKFYYYYIVVVYSNSVTLLSFFTNKYRKQRRAVAFF